MKKILILIVVCNLSILFSACSDKIPENINDDNVATTLKTTEATIEDDYVINIPYSCFDEVSDEDAIVTGTDMRNGIINKELSDNGGIILTVDRDKYDTLLKYAKEQFEEEVKNVETYNQDVEKIEYSDNLDNLRVYINHSYFETEPQPEQSYGMDGEPYAMIDTVTKVNISFGDLFKDSIYYQSLLKKTDTELLTCKYSYIDSSNDKVMNEFIYPDE